ncbi:MAG: hypothetical protein RJR37_10480 [Peptococcaceae bacterium MAG4]|nr:hypothetical protein [Peptococcaceae bacterium MAG4]
MQIYPHVKLPALPRMADFATWGYAIMEAVGDMGEAFLRAYRKNIAGAVEEAVAMILLVQQLRNSWTVKKNGKAQQRNY